MRIYTDREFGDQPNDLKYYNELFPKQKQPLGHSKKLKKKP